MPKVDRASARMIGMLSKQKGWCESLSDQDRDRIVRGLLDQIPLCDSPRDIASISRAIAGLEHNDLERTKLILAAEQIEQGDGAGEAIVEMYRQAIAEVRDLGGA